MAGLDKMEIRDIPMPAAERERGPGRDWNM